MNPALYTLSATMVNQLNRVDVISNNIANANTNGFKQDNLVEGSFNYYLQRSQEQNTEISHQSLVHNTVPKIDGDYMTAEVGSITGTGNKLDFALKDNETFFQIQNEKGDVLLTRDGSFKNVNGFLGTSQGEKVLNADKLPIAIAEGFEEQIALVKTPFTNLQKVGDNNYLTEDDKKIEKILFNDSEMLQGSIERSNVNTVSAMVALIDSQRRLEQSQKAIKGISDINSKLIMQVGNR